MRRAVNLTGNELRRSLAIAATADAFFSSLAAPHADVAVLGPFLGGGRRLEGIRAL